MDDQLHLGEGELGEQVDFDEHEVKTPAGLYMDEQVPVAAKGAYGIMKSFGKRAEASLAAYSKRGACDPDTFRKLQKVLQNTAWVVLLREGKDQQPRLWWMCKVKGEQPPMAAFMQAGSQTVGGVGAGGKKPGSEKNQGGKKRDPKQSSSRVLEGSDKTTAAKAAPWTAADGSLYQDLVDDYYQAFKVAKNDPGAVPECTATDFSKLKQKARDPKFTRQLYKARLANLPFHNFSRLKEFSLGHFIDNFREFDDKANGIILAKNGGRPGSTRYNAVTKVEDFDGGSGNG